MRHACEEGLKAPWLSRENLQHCSLVCKESQSELLQMRSVLNLTTVFQLYNSFPCWKLFSLKDLLEEDMCLCFSPSSSESGILIQTLLLSCREAVLKANKEQDNDNYNQLQAEDENILKEKLGAAAP